MSDLNKLKQLAGIPIDLSKVENAKTSVRAPNTKTGPVALTEHAKVPQHRGELAPKTKDNMKARVNNMKKALEALEEARECLMEVPAIDYMEDIPTLIKQLHHMLHGDDGTGGVHHLHRYYKNEFDNTVFPEDIEEERRKEEEDQLAADAGITGDEPDTSKKKKTNEAMGFSVGFTKQSKDEPSDGKKNVRPFKLAPGSDKKTMYQDAKSMKEVGISPRDAKGEDVVESETAPIKNPSIEQVAAAHHAWRNKKATDFDPTHLETPPRDKAEADVKAADRQNPEEEENTKDHLLAQHTHAQKMLKRASDPQEIRHWGMEIKTIEDALAGSEEEEAGGQFSASKAVTSVSNDEEDPAQRAWGIEDHDGESVNEATKKKKPKWLEKKEVEAEEKEGKTVSKAEKKKVNEANHETVRAKVPAYTLPAHATPPMTVGTTCPECGEAIPNHSQECSSYADAPYEDKPYSNEPDATAKPEEEQKSKVTIKRCPDCGEFGEIRGHMGCQYPSDEEDCSMSMPMEGAKSKKPKWLEKKEVEAEEKEGKKVSKAEKKKVDEAGSPLFARDAFHPKHNDEERYPSWAPGKKPVNVVSDEEPSIYYPNGAKNENPSQLATNPYNENQKVKVPTAIKSALNFEADTARKLAETYNMRRDWDNMNFHETLANAFETLVNFLNKETIYGIKEAQVFMTSLMSPIMNKIPAPVIKYIAAGGTLRSLKSYVNDVKEPVTSPDVFHQDSNGMQD